MPSGSQNILFSSYRALRFTKYPVQCLPWPQSHTISCSVVTVTSGSQHIPFRLTKYHALRFTKYPFQLLPCPQAHKISCSVVTVPSGSQNILFSGYRALRLTKYPVQAHKISVSMVTVPSGSQKSCSVFTVPSGSQNILFRGYREKFRLCQSGRSIKPSSSETGSAAKACTGGGHVLF